jgi:dTDP-4-amino-4,6-dideoxygalactose transaminase
MIQMNAFTAEPEDLRRDELESMARVARSGWFILGREVKAFEEAWASYCRVPFCVGVGNGLDAIEIGLRAMGIGPGDEVITTPMTAIATILAIVHAGATPVLADIDPDTALLDLASVDRAVTGRTKAVLLVHLYGQIAEMDRWTAFCEERGVHLLEDCAQSHGAAWNGKMAGRFGPFGAFSFYPTKNLGAKGDAGALVTSSAEIADKARVLRNYGTRTRYEHPEVGVNSRLDEVQAAILNVRLAWLDRFNARRKDVATRYSNGITNPRVRPLAPPRHPSSHVYHLFVVRCAERDRLAGFLNDRGIETLVHYPIPAHEQRSLTGVRRDPRGLPNAELHARECLSIPCHPQLLDEEVATVIASLNAFLK